MAAKVAMNSAKGDVAIKPTQPKLAFMLWLSMGSLVALVGLACSPRPVTGAIFYNINAVLKEDTSDKVSSSEAHEKGKPGLRELKFIVTRNSRGEVCKSMVHETYKRMQDHYYGIGRSKQMLSYAKTFATAFAYQLVGHCKLNTVKQLKKMDQILGAEGMAAMNLLEKKGAWVVDEETLPRSAFKNTDLLSVGTALVAMVRSSTGRHHELTVPLSAVAMERLKALRVACLDVYMPVWKELTYTVVNMADMGYDVSLNDKLNQAQRGQFIEDEDMRRWVNTMLACEAVNRMPMFGNYQSSAEDIPTVKNAKKLLAEPMPEELVVDQDYDLESLKSTAKDVSRETEKLKRTVYKHVLGTNWSVSDRLAMSGSKFWTNYVAFLNQKLST